MGYIDQLNAGYSEYGQDTPKRIPIAKGVSTIVLLENPSRVCAKLVNNSRSQVYIQELIPAELEQGQPLCESNTLQLVGDELTTKQINAIAVDDDAFLDVTEGEF